MMILSHGLLYAIQWYFILFVYLIVYIHILFGQGLFHINKTQIYSENNNGAVQLLYIHYNPFNNYSWMKWNPFILFLETLCANVRKKIVHFIQFYCWCRANFFFFCLYFKFSSNFWCILKLVVFFFNHDFMDKFRII